MSGLGNMGQRDSREGGEDYGATGDGSEGKSHQEQPISPPGGRPPTTSPCPSPSPDCAPLTSSTYAMFYEISWSHYEGKAYDKRLAQYID